MNTRDRIDLFLADARRLADAAYLKVAAQSKSFNKLTVSWVQGGPMTMTTTEPSETALNDLLRRLRPFIIKGEPTNLDGMYNLCERKIRSDELRGYLPEARREWIKAQPNNGMVGLRINERGMPHLGPLSSCCIAPASSIAPDTMSGWTSSSAVKC